MDEIHASYSFYPHKDDPCPNVGHCPHVGGAGIASFVLIGNLIGRNAVKSLVGNFLYFHRIDFQTRQAICEKLDTEYDTDNLNPEQKKIRSDTAPRLTEQAVRKKKDKRKKEKREKKRRKRSSR